MKKLAIVLIFVLLPVCAWAESAWRFISPMPHGRYVHGSTLGQDGKIYVMGGLVSENGIDRHHGVLSNLVYDPNKDAWEYLTPVPGWVGSYALYNREKKKWDGFYFLGGKAVRPGGGEVKEYVEIGSRMDEVRNTDFTRQGNGVAIVTAKNGSIWWIGGQGKWVGHGENIVLPFDPARDQWPKVTAEEQKLTGGFTYKTVYHTDIPRMQESRIDHKAVVTSDGKIYVMGGYRLEPAEASDTMECYDSKTNTWEYKKPLTSMRMSFAAVVGPDDKIYIFGGAKGMADDDRTPVLDTTEVYDPKTDTWSFRKPMPEAREAHAAVLAADGKIYIMGGSKEISSPPLADVFIYDPVNDSWQKGPSMNTRRAVLSAVATPDGKIYAIGGTDIGAYSGRATLNYLFGGDRYAGKVQDTVEVLDVSK